MTTISPPHSSLLPLLRKAVVVGAVLLPSACSGGVSGGEPAGGQPRRGGTLVMASSIDYDAFNAFVSTDAGTQLMMRHILFMTLVQQDAAMNLRPYLAEGWQVTDDGLSVTYQIRKDVTWHDGTPTTAEDVKFTYERASDPQGGFANVGMFEHYRSAEVLAPHTIRFNFSRPFPEQVQSLAFLPIMPKHLLERVPPAEMRATVFNRQPVGNGPFKFVRWKANEEVVFEAYEGFSPSLGGRPYIDRLVVRLIPEQAAQVAMLLTGQIDMMSAVPPRDAARIEASDVARLFTFPSRAYVFIGWNARLPLFDTARERVALTLAIDRQQIVDALLEGYGSVPATGAFETHWARDRSLQPLPYDPRRAKALLRSEGWVDSDGDGVLDRGGRRFEFELLTNTGNQLREDVALMVTDHLSKIGVVAKLTVHEWTSLVEQVELKRFEAWVTGLDSDFTETNPRDLFHSEAIDGQYNFVSFANGQADSLIDLGLSLTDREEAKPVWAALQRILAEQQPHTSIYAPRERLGVSHRVQGLKDIDVGGHMLSVRQWWIAE